MSVSKRFCEEGNKSYQRAAAAGLSPLLVISRLQDALNAYFRAEQSAINPDEKASAQKNYAKASWWLAAAQEKRKEKVVDVHTSLKNGFQYYVKAVKCGVDKPVAWRQDLKLSMQLWFDFSCQYYMAQTSGMERSRLFEELGRTLPDGNEKGQCYLSMCEALYLRGVKVMQDGDFRMSLSLMKVCYFPLEEASRILKDKPSVSEINILREDVFLLTCISESHQARFTGDTMLEKAIMEEESLNISLVYSGLDNYRHAIILVREKEVEVEAAVLSRIGWVYGQVLKMKYQAMEYYKKCIELAGTLAPKSPDNEGDTMLEKALMEEESLNMSFVYSGLDNYRHAIILVREKEVEVEAAVLSRIGWVYGQVLKMKYQAMEYYKKCIELAGTLAPKSPENEEWYKEAKKFIEECKKEDEEKERSKWENIRKEHIKSLKDDIKKFDKLSQKNTGEKLVRYIYETYPPKDEKHVILDSPSPWDNQMVRKALLRALRHYHPDKIDIDKHGAKWKVLCEEITKIMTTEYTVYKGGDL